MPQTLTASKEPTPAGSLADKRAQRWVLIAAILGTSMAFIDGTVVNVALPALQTYFHATGSQVQWVVESFALFLAALILVGGGFSDIFGLRKVFLLGTAVFGVASAGCGFAPTIQALIFARACQGIGAAMLVPGSLALISASYPVETRGKAIGTWSGATAIGAAIGPLLGGWLVQQASWRWVFFINIPIALITLGITFRLVPDPRSTRHTAALDWPGALLATLGLGFTTYALIESAASRVPLWWLGNLGLVILVGFVYVEAKAPSPMLPLPLFRTRNFSGANLITLFLYAAIGGVFFYLPLNLMQVQHFTPFAAGAALLPFIILLFLLSRWSGGLVTRHGARLPLVIGPVITTFGLLLMLVPGINADYWTTFFPAILVLGLGMAICVAPLTTVVMNAVPDDLAGSASGINNATSRVAGLLAVALFGMLLSPIFDRSLKHGLDSPAIPSQVREQVYSQHSRLAAIETTDPNAARAVQQAFVTGYRGIMLVCTVLSLLAAITGVFYIRNQQTTSETKRPSSYS